MMTNYIIVISILLSALFLAIQADDDEQKYRIFPAAKIESYNHNIDISVLGIVSTNNITFSIVPSTTHGQNNNTKVVENFLQHAIRRFRKSLTRFPDFNEDYTVNPLDLPLRSISNINIIVESSDVKLYHNVPEDYKLVILEDSDIVSLKASTVFGILRGLETLGQLLEFGWMDTSSSPMPINTGDGAAGGIFCIRDIPLFISDAPSYPYRGLMIDTARHYLPLNLILDNLDVMEMNKMNVLHWHISDSQSFPYATSSFPELATKGAYHPKRIYTVKDVQTVIRAAYLRGIRVIPEIDLPGHTNAIAKSHPEVMSHCPNPSEPINPTVPETYNFVETIYKDLNDVFPDDYIHVGGDEVQLSEKCWLNDTSIVEWMKLHNMNKTVELYEYFETRLLNIVANIHKIPIVWQEVFNLNLTIPPNTIIDVWKGFDTYTIQNATNKNFQVILSGCWYLDHLDCSWQKFYECDPRNFTGNTDLMIGGHASMWGEHVDSSNFISRVWPRASAAAERLWLGGNTNTTTSPAAKSIADRIHKFRCRMVLQGFAAGPTGPGFCPTEVQYQSRYYDKDDDNDSFINTRYNYQHNEATTI